ncbi:MAG: saccharopine dehydrogenase NADP-binding domain-containing protein [Nocardioides sp.]
MALAAAGTMRVLLVGAGEIAFEIIAIAVGRDFFERIVIADYDPDAAQRAAFGDRRLSRAQVDPAQTDALVDLIHINEVTHVLNAAGPEFAMPVFNASRIAGVDHLDLTGGARELQCIQDEGWRANSRLALVGIGGAISAVVALELLATGVWAGAGVLAPEAFDSVPFDDLADSFRTA